MTNRQKALERLKATPPPPLREPKPSKGIKYAIIFAIIVILLLLLII